MRILTPLYIMNPLSRNPGFAPVLFKPSSLNQDTMASDYLDQPTIQIVVIVYGQSHTLNSHADLMRGVEDLNTKSVQALTRLNFH